MNQACAHQNPPCRASRWLAAALCVWIGLSAPACRRDEAPASTPSTAAAQPGEASLVATSQAPVAPTPSAPAPAAPSASASNSAHKPRKALDAAAEQWHRDYEAAIRGHLAVLSARGGAQSQLGIALLLPLAGPNRDLQVQRLASLRKASDGGDPFAAWLLAVDCGEPVCLTMGVQNRAIELAPDNFAPMLLDLEFLAEKAPQIARLRMGAAAARGRYDDHYGEAGRRTLALLEQIPLPSRSAALGRALGHDPRHPPSDEDLRTVLAAQVDNAVALPPLRGVRSACPAPAAADEDTPLHFTCITLLSKLSETTSVRPRRLALIQRLERGGPPDYMQPLREELRQLEWAFAHPPPGAGLDLERLRERWRLGEIPAQQAWLERRRLSTAPADWLPESERIRALIVGPPLATQPPTQ